MAARLLTLVQWAVSLRAVSYTHLVSAVYVSLTIAVLATLISTVLGTISAIGLSKSRKVLKEYLTNVNNIPILNPEIVTAIGLMLLFSSVGMTKGYLTMLLALSLIHISLEQFAGISNKIGRLNKK